MKGKLALALVLIGLAPFSMIASTSDDSIFDDELMDPSIPMLEIEPFPEYELSDLMLEVPDISALENDTAIVSHTSPESLEHIDDTMNLSIGGKIFDDQNYNGIKDEDESGLSNWTVRLMRDGVEILNISTDEFGSYRFDNLSPGSYIVAEDLLPGWNQTLPGTGIYQVSLVDKSLDRYDFGNVRFEIIRSALMTRSYPTMHFTPEEIREWNELDKRATPFYPDPKIVAEIRALAGQPFSLLDHLEYVPEERDQGNCGNCWIWAGTAVMEIDLDVRRTIRDRLSVQYATSKYNNGSCSRCGSWACCGGNPYGFAKFYNDTGMEISWSNHNAEWMDNTSFCKNCITKVPSSSISEYPGNYPIISVRADPITFVDNETAIENITAALLDGKAVYFDFFLPTGDNWSDFRSYFHTEPENEVIDLDFANGKEYNYSEGEGAGHSVVCVGYNDTDPNNRYWVMLNSWGTGLIGGKRPNGTFLVNMDMNYSSEYVNFGKAFRWYVLNVTYPDAPEVPEEEWNKTFGGAANDHGHSVQQTTDGGYIVAGWTSSFGAGLDDAWMIKTDSAGIEIWNKTFGGTSHDEGESVQQTTDGGYVVAGYTGSYGAGSNDVWLIRTDSSGNEIWNETFGGTGHDEGNSVQQTTDGGYVIAGYTRSFGGGIDHNVWLIKTDSDGNEMWNKTFGGSVYDEIGYSVQQTNDGGYVIAGYTSSYGAGGPDVWLIKTDSLGNEVWNKTFGGSSSEQGYSVQQTTDGGYVIVGYTSYEPYNYCDGWLIKTDSAGNEIWNKTLSGAGNSGHGYSVQQTTDGGYIVLLCGGDRGESNTQIVLTKTDILGNEVWAKRFGGYETEAGYSVQQTSDGGYIIGGSTNSFGSGNYDVWLIKVGSDNEPPAPPTVPQGPDEGIAGESIEFSTSSTDPDGDQVKYVFDWDDGMTSGSDLVDSGTLAGEAHCWRNPGTYNIKVKAIDSKCLSSEWSDTKIVTVIDTPAPEEEWNKTFGGSSDDVGYSVQQTSEGGYIIVGQKFYSLWLIKTDAAGNTVWDKTFTFNGWYSGSRNSVQQTTDGGYIIASSNNAQGHWYVWLIKTDSLGNKLWDKTFGETCGNIGCSVQQTGDGGYVISSGKSGNGDVWLIKTDSLGNKLWDKTFGGTSYDYGFSVRQTSDDGYIIAGVYDDSDVLLIKTDSSGTETWNKTFGGSSRDVGYSILETSDGGYVIAGYTTSYGAGNRDVWLIKTDPYGIEIWNKTFGGLSGDEGNSVQETSDGRYVIAGYTTSYGAGSADFWLIKTESDGNMVWNKTFGGTDSDIGYSVLQTTDGGYIIAGFTNSYGAGGSDVWLIKVKPENPSETLSFDYPVGTPRALGGTGYVTEENDSDGWYNAQDWRVYNEDYGGYHPGEDWNGEGGGSSDVGAPVYAAADGVVFATTSNVAGEGIAIEHTMPNGDPIYSVYIHIAIKSGLSVGSVVSQGEQIGTIADITSQGMSPHLHFEMRTEPVNPLDWYPNDLGNGYYETISLLEADGFTVDPSDFIDSHRGEAEPRFCIYGYKVDVSTGEHLDGWRITLKDDAGNEIANTTTNSTGYYQFCNLVPGDYEVCEEIRDGWTSVDATCVAVTLVNEDVGVGFFNEPKKDGVGVFDPTYGIWFLDYDNDGVADKAFYYGATTHKPISGDWDGDGKDTVGVFDPATSLWFLDNDNDGVADQFVYYGASTHIPVTGDWDGDGTDTVGVFDPTYGIWFLDYDNDGIADTAFYYGAPTHKPVVGDWDGDGTDTVGVFDPSTSLWFLDNNNDGVADIFLYYGASTHIPVPGDWDGDGTDTVGVFDPSTSLWFLDNNNDGVVDQYVYFGASTHIPVKGNWLQA